MVVEGISTFLPRPVLLLPRQPLLLPQQAGPLLLLQAPFASVPAVAAGTGGGASYGSLGVGALSMAVAGLLLSLLLYRFTRILGCKRTEDHQVSESYYLLL